MRFEVRVAEKAVDDAGAIANWISVRGTSDDASRWTEGLLSAVEGLSEFPRRFPRARVASKLGIEVRQRNFGLYRIYFAIIEMTVFVLHIRSSWRRPASRSDLSAAIEELREPPLP